MVGISTVALAGVALGGMFRGAGSGSLEPPYSLTFLDYLASEPVLSEFYARSLFVPGHLGIAAKGLDYQGASAPAKELYKHFGIIAEAAVNATLKRLG